MNSELPNLGGWNMSDERAFMENLLCQRFNFFLVTFSLVLTAAFTADAGLGRTIILAAGVAITFFVWLTIYRAHIKHHWIMQHLYKRYEHPAAIVNEAVKTLGWRSFTSVSSHIGIWIPWLCIIVLLLLTTLSLSGCL